MLFLIFQIAGSRYGLDARELVEVLPLLNLTKIPKVPRAIAGVFNYHGTLVPAVDLSELMLERPAQNLLSTRLIVANFAGCGAVPRLLGLIAERAGAVLHLQATQFRKAGVSNVDAPYLGPVAFDESGLIQWVDVNRLLPATVQTLLFES